MSSNYQDRQFIPPSHRSTPRAVHPADRQTAHPAHPLGGQPPTPANAARRALREAPEQYRPAVTAAAAAGKDVTKAPDPRGPAAEEYELREIAERGLAARGHRRLGGPVEPGHRRPRRGAGLRRQALRAGHRRGRRPRGPTGRGPRPPGRGPRGTQVGGLPSHPAPTTTGPAVTPPGRSRWTARTPARSPGCVLEEAKAARPSADQAGAAASPSIERAKREQEKEQRRLEERKARRAAARS
jgi:hypothetical protein